MALPYSPYIKTALHFAVENKSSKKVLEWLIQFGVPVDSVCDYLLGQPSADYSRTPRETALDIAVKMGDVVAFDVLIQHGASVGPILHTHPNSGSTGIFNHHSRWMNPYIHSSMIEKLWKAGAELNGSNYRILV